VIVILGLVILVAAVIIGVAGVFSNGGSAHALPHGFEVLGYHVTGSTGTLFLYGIVVGAVVLLGLSLLLGGARRTSRRGSEARRSLQQSRRETAAVSKDRDELIGQRDTVGVSPASKLGNGTVPLDPPLSAGNGRPSWMHQLGAGNGRPSWMHQLGQRFAARQAAGTKPEPLASRPVPDAPAGSPVRDVPAGSSVPVVPAGSSVPVVPAGSPVRVVPAGSSVPVVPAGSPVRDVPAGSSVPVVPADSSVRDVPVG
jgi:hypothetical protein